MKNFQIAEFREINPLAVQITNPILKLLLKCRKHPSVTATGDLNVRSDFRFSVVSTDEVLKENKKVNPRKADIFANYIYGSFNKFINSSKYPSILTHSFPMHSFSTPGCIGNE